MTAQGSPNNTVAVASGTVVVASVEVAVSSGNVTMTAAHATLARFDFITVNGAGTKAYTVGTAATTPVFPAIPASSVVLAAIYVDANDNVINSNQIVDKRVSVPTPSGFTGWLTVDKPVGTSRSSTTTLTADPHLSFVMAAGGKYRLRGRLNIVTPDAADFKWRHVGPASPNRVQIYRMSRSSATGAVNVEAIDRAFSTADINVAVGSELDTIVEFEGIIANATAGNFEIHWAQQTSNAGDTELTVASYIDFQRAD